MGIIPATHYSEAGARLGDMHPQLRSETQTSPRLQQFMHWWHARPALHRDVLPVTATFSTALSALAPDMDESFCIELSADGCHIQAPTDVGVLRGFAVLVQLAHAGQLCTGVIEDAPRFTWRGLMLDPARRFLETDAILATLAGMWLLHLNVLHLHLSDDQAVRFHVPEYPELASEPHYTREDLSRIVDTAAQFGIRVVPELDMPGHVSAMVAAYPQWGRDEAVQQSLRFGVHKAALNPAREVVFEAMGHCLDLLAQIFPDACVHLGGDEVHPAWWSADAEVAALMQREGLASVKDVQAWFQQRVTALAHARGKRVVGWDEVIHPELSDKVIVQCWRGATPRDRALANGNDVVVSGGFYLDLMYPADVHYLSDPAAPADVLLAQEDALLQDARFAHVAAGMRWTHQWRESAQQPRMDSARILGGEACLWSELVDTDTLPVRLWSRLPAVAWCLWSVPEVTLVRTLGTRIERFTKLLAALGIVDVYKTQSDGFVRAGVEDVTAQALLCWLEPVKWYARLLGEAALQARLRGTEMPQSRPYGTDTPLNRVVDFLAPEAPMYAGASDMSEAELRSAALGLRHTLSGLGNQWPADLQPVMTQFARLLDAWLDGAGDFDDVLSESEQPVGEYLIAMARLLRERHSG